MIFIFLFGCKQVKQQKTENFPIIDLSESYPKKEILLQDIADIEYVALETTDDVIISAGSDIAYISDEYIVIRDIIQNSIFVFNREGKIRNHFNRIGNSAQEYIGGIAKCVVDGKNDEIFVIDFHKILVYSFSGEYKRTIPVSKEYTLMDAYNFDDNNLLICDNNGVRQNSGYREDPYYLISKQDGSITYILDIRLPLRYTNRWATEVELPRGE